VALSRGRKPHILLDSRIPGSQFQLKTHPIDQSQHICFCYISELIFGKFISIPRKYLKNPWKQAKLLHIKIEAYLHQNPVGIANAKTLYVQSYKRFIVSELSIYAEPSLHLGAAICKDFGNTNFSIFAH
jgi:hypothetical protein